MRGLWSIRQSTYNLSSIRVRLVTKILGNVKKEATTARKTHLLNSVETLGDPYYKRVPLPRVPEYRNLSQDSQLTKSTVKFAAVEPTIISNYPNGYLKIFGHRRVPITPSFE